MERLLDLLKQLPAGTRLSTTPAFARAAGRTLRDASIQQACKLVMASGYQEQEAEYSDDGQTITMYAGGQWIPWPAFTFKQ